MTEEQERLERFIEYLQRDTSYPTEVCVIMAKKFCRWDRTLDYCDNFRFAEVGNAEEEAEYHRRLGGGCCGFMDEEFSWYPDGFPENIATYMIGCNYGH